MLFDGVDKQMKITAYRLYDQAVVIQSSLLAKDWGTKGAFTATKAPSPSGQHWNLLCPLAFEATWNGGPNAEDIEIRLAGEATARPVSVQSHLGGGVLTFYPGYQFKTDDAHALWLRGPVGASKDGLSPLEQIVDTALLPCTVAIHCQFTRQHQTIRFEAGEPFATLLLYPKAELEQMNVEVMQQLNDVAAHEQAFARMIDSPALHDLFQQLGATTNDLTQHSAVPPSNGQSVPNRMATQRAHSASDDYLDTVDGRLNMRHFGRDFFRRERLVGTAYEANLRRYGEVVPRIFYLIDPLKLAYLETPKVACTAIRMALAQASGISFDRSEGFEYHLYIDPQWHRVAGKLDRAQCGYDRFSFVRNPFDRLVSCYRSKVIYRPSPKQVSPHFQNYFFTIPVNISFADFVERVSQIPDALADAHFKSQYAMLSCDGELQVDYLGRFEWLADDWRPIAERYQLEPLLEAANVSKNKPGTHSDYRLYYTEPLVHWVYERYRKDVEAFGYQEEYEQLLEFVRRPEQNALPAASEGEWQQEKELNRHEC